MDGKNILHPLNPELENKIAIDYKDIHGTKVIETVIKDLKINKEAYNTYYWNKPDSKEPSKEYKKYHLTKYLNLIIYMLVQVNI